jgi:hypothetical protein
MITLKETLVGVTKEPKGLGGKAFLITYELLRRRGYGICYGRCVFRNPKT